MFTQKVILLKLLTYYMDTANSKTPFTAYDPRIQKAIEYIEQNILHQITSKDLGAHTGLHPNYFIRLFKSQTGQSPVNFMNQIRMNKAKELLRSTDFPVCDVSLMVGIPNYSYFSRQFKASVNFSPTEYRLMMQNEDKKNYPDNMLDKSVML
jgi:transcriptional regulator GlxA family with amidase domain